jgi:hypothetical protein
METIQEMTDGWLAAGKKKGLKMPVKGNESEEIFLSKVKMVCESAGVKLTESRQRITRHNGSGVIVESDKTERIANHARKYRCSIQEATIFVTGVNPGPASDVKESTEVVSLMEAWLKYAPALQPDEARSLAKRNVPVPTR